MSLLERIAQSNGNPQRTIAALRLLNGRLKRKLTKASIQVVDLLATSNEMKVNKPRRWFTLRGPR
jgi:hypothetical protein